MLIKIQSWLCYALSSSFNHFFGKWSWWKILLYIVFSFIISLAVLFARECSSSSQIEAHTTFLVLLIICIFSFFFDKEVKGKPDAYSLISFAAFSIMSLGLSRLSHFGFEADLLYFSCGVLTVQLMKIKLWLVVFGGRFSYSLIILRSTFDPRLRSGYHGVQERDHVVVEIGSNSPLQGTDHSASPVDALPVIVTGTENDQANGVTMLDSHLEGNTDRDSSVVRS